MNLILILNLLIICIIFTILSLKKRSHIWVKHIYFYFNKIINIFPEHNSINRNTNNEFIATNDV
jgi:hypothetical protein